MLTMKDIVRDPAPILHKKAAAVDEIDEETINQLKLMREYLINSQDPELSEKYDLRPGVGIAAPQVGIDKRMFVVYTEDEDGNIEHDYMLINPKIKSHSVTETYLPGGEGCLSVDEDVEGLVHRYSRIKMQATTPDGEKIEIKAKGHLAIVLQHEFDHLNGVMFYEHIDKEMPLEPKIGAKPLEL